MIIDLKKIFVNEDSSLPIEYALDLSTTEYQGEFPLKKPVSIRGTVTNKASLVRLEASVNFEYEAPCDRCGDTAVKIYNVPIERVLVGELENDENDEIILVEDYKLDLYELVYTEVVLAMPNKHLCREDCKGICQECGKNLNDGPCGCATKTGDPRLAALRKLLEDND